MAKPFKMKGFSGFKNSPMTKKSPAKGRETWSTEDDRENTAAHNKKHADGTWDEDHKTQMDIDREKYEYKPSKEELAELEKAGVDSPIPQRQRKMRKKKEKEGYDPERVVTKDGKKYKAKELAHKYKEGRSVGRQAWDAATQVGVGAKKLSWKAMKEEKFQDELKGLVKKKPGDPFYKK